MTAPHTPAEAHATAGTATVAAVDESQTAPLAADDPIASQDLQAEEVQ